MSEDGIDLVEVLERVQDDKELLLELFELYLEDYEQKRKLLTEAVKTKDFEQIKSIAHSLKGASGNISAKKLYEMFLTIEQKAKDEDFNDIDLILANLDNSFVDVKNHIDKIRQQEGS